MKADGSSPWDYGTDQSTSAPYYFVRRLIYSTFGSASYLFTCTDSTYPTTSSFIVDKIYLSSNSDDDPSNGETYSYTVTDELIQCLGIYPED
jgi:ubiquinone biosynthesis protein COQ9